MGKVAFESMVTDELSLKESYTVVILGAGRVATHLVPIIHQEAGRVVQIWSRSIASAQLLAEPIDVPYTNDLCAVVSDADIYIVCVVDDALPHVAAKLAEVVSIHRKVSSQPLLLHTSGSVPVEVWRQTGAMHYGVIYPLQTFSKNKFVDMSKVPFFIESSDNQSMVVIKDFVHKMSLMVHVADSASRMKLHIAAVFACNFTNAMYDAAYRLLAQSNLPFEVMLPLIEETANKVKKLIPREAQTGPASRGDHRVVRAHIEALLGDDELLEMYKLISKYINNINK